jgi:ABC-type phosphate transport system permease subunit
MAKSQNLTKAVVTHTYIEFCESLNYIVFLLAPIIVVAIVFRVTYGWKAKKAIKAVQPWRFFEETAENRIYDKNNIKFVKNVIETLLSITCALLISFQLYYFVCPWREFAYESTSQRVLSIQLLIIYPIA